MRRKGFTLIELMIVIAIIAIIAAIAIPGLLAAQRASNERNASASLKTLTSQESDFRNNDRDGNQQNDFWTRDVYALYGLIPITSGATAPPADVTVTTLAVKLIDVSIAGADGRTDQVAYGNVNFDVGIGLSGGSAKAGYYYRAYGSANEGGGATTLLNDTDGATFYPNANPSHDRNRFAFAAAPESLSSGKLMFIVNQDAVIWKYNLPATYALVIGQQLTGTATDSSITWSGTGQAASLDFAAAVGGGATFPAAPGNIGCSKMD